VLSFLEGKTPVPSLPKDIFIPLLAPVKGELVIFPTFH